MSPSTLGEVILERISSFRFLGVTKSCFKVLYPRMNFFNTGHILWRNALYVHMKRLSEWTFPLWVHTVHHHINCIHKYVRQSVEYSLTDMRTVSDSLRHMKSTEVYPHSKKQNKTILFFFYEMYFM